MLTCESVRSTDSPHFAMLDALYARAFPWHEQRESEQHSQRALVLFRRPSTEHRQGDQRVAPGIGLVVRDQQVVAQIRTLSDNLSR